MNIDRDQINKLLKKYLKDLIREYDKPADPNWQLGEEDHHKYQNDQQAVQGSIEILEELKTEYNARIHSGDYAEVEGTATKLMTEQGIAEKDIDKKSPLYHHLCSGLLRVKVKEFQHQQKKLSGTFSDELETILEDSPPLNKPAYSTAPSPLPAPTPVDQGPLLSEFMEKFPETKPKWDKASHSSFRTTTKVALKILGDIPIGSITRAMMVNYRETLAKSPTYWTSRHKNVKAEDLPVEGLPTIGKSNFERNLVLPSKSTPHDMIWTLFTIFFDSLNFGNSNCRPAGIIDDADHEKNARWLE